MSFALPAPIYSGLITSTDFAVPLVREIRNPAITVKQGEQTRYKKRTSRHQPVAAAFGDQKLGLAGAGLNLLAQPVDMGFQRVGGYSRVVAPDLVQQRIPRHGIPRPVEELQDVGFLLGQPHPLALGIDQQFGAGPEGVGADPVDRILALAVASQMRMQ